MKCVYSLKFSINRKSFSKQFFFFLKKRMGESTQTTLLRSFAIKRSKKWGRSWRGLFLKAVLSYTLMKTTLTKGKADDEEVNLPKWRGDRRFVQAEAWP